MRRSLAIALALLVLLLVLVLSQCNRKPVVEKVALPLPAGTPNRPHGMTALAVRPGQAEPFSKEDVAAYVQAHNLPLNRGAAAGLRVEALEFLTSKQVSDRLQGASTGLADTDTVGFATLGGEFIFTGPSPGKSVKFSRGYAVFDTRTGNLMMVGALDQGQPQPGQ